MAGFELYVWSAGSDVDSVSAYPVRGGRADQGSSLTQMTSEGTSEGGGVVLDRDCLLIPLQIKLTAGW